ncbi:MAG: pH regulation protein F [Gammaproteobacteria bacterium]|nr:MAG: pH regulation protein F [Gammaproteobacteria bacterium]
MTVLLPAVVVFLLLNLVAGLWRVYTGPSAADRMLSALLFGSTTVAILLLLAQWQDSPALRVAALLFVMLAAITSIAFVAMVQGGAARRQPATRANGTKS